MATPALTTILKMIEILPESRQNQVVEHLREYIADLEDEDKWDKAFAITRDNKNTLSYRSNLLSPWRKCCSFFLWDAWPACKTRFIS